MGSDKFQRNVIIRIIILVLSVLLVSRIQFSKEYLYTLITLGLVTVLQAWSLFNYISRQRRDISRMLSYIKDSNPTIFFSEKKDTPFTELGDFLNEIGDIVRNVRIEKEEQLRYMNYITAHVPVGLMAYDSSGNIDFINDTAMDMLGLKWAASLSSLDRVKKGLASVVSNLKPGQVRIETLQRERVLLHLAIKSSHFTLGNREVRLVSFQDIRNELDEKEMEAWQKLIRVLTHEIINSVTPVTSLSSAIGENLKRDGRIADLKELSYDDIERTVTGLSYIEKRAHGLIDFVNRYRRLTRIPEPKLSLTPLNELCTRSAELVREENKDLGISVVFDNSAGDINTECDPVLIEHVLINLLRNACEAFNSSAPENREVRISTCIDKTNTACIIVTDNGPGIPEEIKDDIFIPFFTTREKGSGIGLSLSRQIMRLHGGSLFLSRSSAEGSEFTIKFPGGSVNKQEDQG